MNQNISEKALIRACIRHDRKAQRTLYDMHKTYLFGVSLRYVKFKDEAEDILQEGFYNILKDLKQFNGKGELRAWMRKVIINTALMYIRKYHKVKFTDINAVDAYGYEIEHSEAETNRTDTIIRLIQSLPMAQQTVFNLKAMDGYDFKEIAEILSINESTLRSHFLRARKKLQSLLKQELNYDG